MNRSLPAHLHRKHGAYYYVVRVEGRTKWLRLSADYGEALRKWAEIEGGKPAVQWTVARAIGHYLDVSRGRLKPATIKGYEWSAKALIPVFGHMPVGELRKAHVYSYVVARGNVAGNRERALLSAVYTHLGQAGIYDGPNPARELRFRNPEKPRKRYVTDGELLALEAAAKPRMRALVRFAYLTGARERDILALRLTAATDAGIRYTASKTGHETLVAWSDDLRALWRQIAGLRVGNVPAFLTRDGRAYTPSGFRASWRKLKLRAGLPDITFHDLRRKAGSDADTEAHAQALLGHEDGKVTRRHYRAKVIPVEPLSLPSARQRPKR